MTPNRRLLTVLVIFFVTGASLPSNAQNLDNPGDYITAISAIHTEMNGKYMQYISTAAHSRKARKIEKMRQEVLDNIIQCRYKTTDLPKYKGDNSLRQGSLNYIQLCYNVFNEDYKKIINVEELAEQSFDEMQAYLLLQDKVNEKLHEGTDTFQVITKKFAEKYNVNLLEDKSPLGAKLEEAGKLNHYRNAIYLLFFKCNWEDAQMVAAMNNKKVNDMEQARNALTHYADEGMKALDTLKTFNGDPSLAVACRQALQFYKQTAEKDIPKLTDFYLKQENFDKLKKAFETKSSSSRTKEDVDAYNKAVNDLNAGIKAFNQTNSQVNNGRTQVLNNWQETERKFADEHTPRYH